MNIFQLQTMGYRKEKFKIFIISAWIIYGLAFICAVFIFPVRERTAKTYEHYFVPFQNTIGQIKNPDQYKTPGYWKVFTTSLAGNFLLFAPMGLLLSITYTTKKISTIFFTCVLISILIELIQLIFHSGVCDVDDVILNSLGALAGIYVSKLLSNNNHVFTCN